MALFVVLPDAGRLPRKGCRGYHRGDNLPERYYGITHFQFSDELLMASEKRTEEVCDAIRSLNFSIKWDCNGRLNWATPHLLKRMKDSGCEYVNYGIESLDQKILNEMGKGLTVSRIFEGVEATLEAGLSPGLNFISGFPSDSIENLWEAVNI